MSEQDDDPVSGDYYTIRMIAQRGPSIAAYNAAIYRGPTDNTDGWYLPNKQELNSVFLQKDNAGVFSINHPRLVTFYANTMCMKPCYVSQLSFKGLVLLLAPVPFLTIVILLFRALYQFVLFLLVFASAPHSFALRITSHPLILHRIAPAHQST
ncbi:MAG: hypothetical protein ACI89S_001816 [Gammaproteobacteria bacterium]